MNHSRQGLLSISDFASYCGTTRQTLQYYDRIGLLKPMQVGPQGYRYYEPLQGHDFRMIHTLQMSGCSLEEAERIIQSPDLDTFLQSLSDKQAELQQEMLRVQRAQIYLERSKILLNWILREPEHYPRMLHLPHTLPLFSYPFAKPDALYSATYYDALQGYAEYCRNNSALQQYPYALLISRDELLMQRIYFSSILCLPGCPLDDPKSTYPISAGDYAVFCCFPEKQPISRRQIYSILLRFLHEQGHTLGNEGLEIPFSVPVGMQIGARYAVIFAISIAAKKEVT